MKKKITALSLLMAVGLSLGLTGCGDDSKEALEKRVTAGEDSGQAADELNELHQEQAEEAEEYLKG